MACLVTSENHFNPQCSSFSWAKITHFPGHRRQRDPLCAGWWLWRRSLVQFPCQPQGHSAAQNQGITALAPPAPRGPGNFNPVHFVKLFGIFQGKEKHYNKMLLIIEWQHKTYSCPGQSSAISQLNYTLPLPSSLLNNCGQSAEQSQFAACSPVLLIEDQLLDSNKQTVRLLCWAVSAPPQQL